jgi:hypothetical protein
VSEDRQRDTPRAAGEQQRLRGAAAADCDAAQHLLRGGQPVLAAVRADLGDDLQRQSERQRCRCALFTQADIRPLLLGAVLARLGRRFSTACTVSGEKHASIDAFYSKWHRMNVV